MLTFYHFWFGFGSLFEILFGTLYQPLYNTLAGPNTPPTNLNTFNFFNVSNIYNIVLALSLVGLLIIVIGVILRFIQDKRLNYMQHKNKRLKIAEYLILDSNTKVFLLQCDDKDYLIVTGSSPREIALGKNSK